MLRGNISFCVRRIRQTGNRHMFNISKIIVVPCTIMLLTNQDIGDKRGSRRLVDVTKDRAVVGQPRERILVFHPACVHARAHTHVAQAACRRLFFFSSLRSVGRRSGRSPLWARYTSHDVVRRVGRCRKRVRFNAVLLPPAYNTRSPPIALLSFCSLRASLRARYTYRAVLPLRSAFVATVKLALRAYASVANTRGEPMDHESAFHAPWWGWFSMVSKVGDIPTRAILKFYNWSIYPYNVVIIYSSKYQFVENCDWLHSDTNLWIGII